MLDTIPASIAACVQVMEEGHVDACKDSNIVFSTEKAVPQEAAVTVPAGEELPVLSEEQEVVLEAAFPSSGNHFCTRFSTQILHVFWKSTARP